MTTTAPSWLPSWPASWPDIEPAYRALVTRVFGDGLFDEDAPDVAEHRAIGTLASWVAQALYWIRDRLHPQHDTGALFLSFWERAFGSTTGGTTTERQNRLLALFRHRIEGDKASIQRMFASIFGTTDPSDVAFASADPDTVSSDADGHADVQTRMHIYSVSGTAPDYVAGRDLIARVKPTYETWSIGQNKTLLWSDSSGETGWDNACWG